MEKTTGRNANIIRRFNKVKKIFLTLFLLFSAAALAYGAFFAWKISTTSQKVSIETNEKKPPLIETVRDLAVGGLSGSESFKKERINILLLGIAGQGKAGQFLTDTIMIASLNPQTGKVALFSLPRDLYVEIPGKNLNAKINAVYQFGLRDSGGNSDKGASLIEKTITSFTGLQIDYHVILTFAGFEKIIDSIGGINIENERDIFDTRYPGPNYSYETFRLKKGFHHLDGSTALKYARERHSDPQGDFGRAKRQQQIMQAAKNKIFSAGVLLDPLSLNRLLEALGDNMRTNISPGETGKFLDLAKKLDTQNINNVALDAWNRDSLLKVIHVDFGGARAFALAPRVGNWSEVRELAENIFDINEIKRRRFEIEKENAAIAILNASGENRIPEKIRKLLNENLKYKNVSVSQNFGKITAETTISYDFSGGAKPFTLNELATRLPSIVSYEITNLPYKNIRPEPDILLVIGKDLIGKYNTEEGTIEDLNKARDDQEMENLNN